VAHWTKVQWQIERRIPPWLPAKELAMFVRSKTLWRDVLLGAFVAALLAAFSPGLNAPIHGVAAASMFAIHKPHCE
jgi:hypothetical protein